jgi:hypothetical protein
LVGGSAKVRQAAKSAGTILAKPRIATESAVFGLPESPVGYGLGLALPAAKPPRYAAGYKEAEMNKPASSDTILGMLSEALTRIAKAVDRWAPPAAEAPDFAAAEAFVWNARRSGSIRSPRSTGSR